MFTVPNILSLLRIPLAFLFLDQSLVVRSIAIVCGGLTDGLDGYIARRYRQSSKLGTLLDPITDKFFVLFLLAVLIFENSLSVWQAAAFLSRDIAVALFGVYLFGTGQLHQYKIRAIWFGKIMTTLQFIVLLALTFKWPLPYWVYGVFVALGVLSMVELIWRRREVEVAGACGRAQGNAEAPKRGDAEKTQ